MKTFLYPDIKYVQLFPRALFLTHINLKVGPPIYFYGYNTKFRMLLREGKPHINFL